MEPRPGDSHGANTATLTNLSKFAPANKHGWLENLLVFNKNAVHLSIRSMFQSAMSVHQKASSTMTISSLNQPLGEYQWSSRKNTGPDSTLGLTASKTLLAAMSFSWGRYIIVILIARRFNMTFWILLSANVEGQSWSPAELSTWIFEGQIKLAPFTRYKHTGGGSRYLRYGMRYRMGGVCIELKWNLFQV